MTRALPTTDVAVSEITRLQANPRIALSSRDPEYRQLRASLKRFGMVRPLVVNRRSGNLLAGHQRLQVAIDLGWDTVPVVHVDVDVEQENAVAVALNAVRGRFDEAALLEAVRTATQDETITLEAVGFTDAAYDELLAAVDAANVESLITGNGAGTPAAEDTGASEEGEADADDERPPPDRAIALTYTVRKHERNLIVRALRAACDLYDVRTPAKALVRVATDLHAGTWPPPAVAEQEGSEP